MSIDLLLTVSSFLALVVGLGTPRTWLALTPVNIYPGTLALTAPLEREDEVEGKPTR